MANQRVKSSGPRIFPNANGNANTAFSSTRAKLADVTDEGLFERLATSVLRISDSRFQGLVETGTNARGHTISDPADGLWFTSMASGERLAVIAHHTIEHRAKLRSKWLDADRGDVAKAVGVFRSVVTQGGDSQCLLVLTCSTDPNSGLVSDLEIAAEKAGIAIELWSGSRLAHVLDVDPDGQWLRHQYLGLPQQRLSLELLDQISAETLELARPQSDPGLHIARNFSEQLAEQFDNGQKLLFLVGESGTGKSVICYEWAKLQQEGKCICLAINEKVLARSATIEEVLSITLKAHAPALSEVDVQGAIFSISDGAPLYLWIEDINRSSSPVEAVRKLLRWTNSLGGTASGEPISRNLKVRFVCPIWVDIVQKLGQDETKVIETLSLSVSGYNPDEARAAVERRARAQGLSITVLRASEAAKALNNDPLLIGLTSDWDRLNASSAIENYIDDAITNLTAKHEHRKSEYQLTLMALCNYLLKNKSLAADYLSVIADMRKKGHEERFRHLISDGSVIKIDNADRLQFRHDRVRDFLLAEYVAGLLDEPASSQGILQDPYLAEAVGLALFGRTNVGAIDKTYKVVSPLALSHAFSCAVKTDSANRVELFKYCGERFVSDEVRKGPNVQQYAIQMVLCRLDGSDVVTLIEFLGAKSFARTEGLARNGIVSSAASYCYSFDPYVNSRHRDALLAHMESTLGDTWVSEVGNYISHSVGSAELQEGALFLAGALGRAELIGPLKMRWQDLVLKKRDLTPGMLFAVMSCAAGRDESFADEVAAVWTSLPETVDGKDHVSPRFDVAHYTLGGGVRRIRSDRLVGYLLSLPGRFPGLTHVLSTIIQYVDHPEALMFVAKGLAEVDERCESSGGFNVWATHAIDQWRESSFRGARAMSTASRLALKAGWQNEENGKWMRKRCFELWSARLKSGDLEELSKHPPQGLEDSALRARLMNGDRSAKPELAKRILAEQNPSYWIQFMRFVDTFGMEDVIKELLGHRRSLGEDVRRRSDLDYFLSELLGDRDDEFAFQIIKENWDHLSEEPCYIVAFLYLATNESLVMAKTAIEKAGSPAETLKHFGMRVGIKTHLRPGIKRIEQLVGVLQYFDYFDEFAIWELWDLCNEKGWFEWRRNNLDHRFKPPRDRAFARLDEGEDFDCLDAKLMAEGDFRNGVHFWAEHRLKAGMSGEALVARAANYADTRRTLKSFQFLCDVVSEHGLRADCAALDVSWAIGDVTYETERLNAVFSVYQRTFE